MSNLTIDDASRDILYSSNWATQTSADPDDDSFFQSTYHSAQADGASANVTFSGSAIYLFGSKGPGHANYSIQFDGDIIFYSAMADETRYRQELFGFTFAEPGTHFVSLVAHFVDGGQWLDLDYITITVNDTTSEGVSQTATSTQPSVSQTITPPWLLGGVSASTTSAATLSSVSSEPTNGKASSSGSDLTLTLAIVFGALFIAAVLFGLGVCLWRRRASRVSGTRPTNYRNYKPRPSGGGSLHGDSEGKIPLTAQLSPRAYGDAHEVVYPPSVASHEKEITSIVEDEHTTNMLNKGPPILPPLDGRNSPFSMLSQGSMAALLKKSSALPQRPKPWRSASTSSVIQPRASRSRPLPQPQALTGAIAPPPVNISPPTRSTSLSRPGAFLPTRRAPTPDTIQSGTSVDSRGARSQTSQSAQSQRPTIAGTATIVGSALTASPQESPMTLSKPLDTERLTPLVPLRANHAQSVFSLDSIADVAPMPKRPRRPGDGLLDWLGNARFLERDPSVARQKKRDDGNSTRTDFLKV